MTPTLRVSRHELLVLGVVLGLALGARAWGFAQIGINHYDEGVYATSAAGLADPVDRHLFPNQIRFSPPFYFVGASVVAQIPGIAPDVAAVLLSMLLGVLTVVAVWYVGRLWFGQAAGLGAATLLAASQFHIMMSRAALTDAAFAFFLVLAVAAIVEALERSSVQLALLGGFLTGLAWNTKYHGWFALVITAGALLPALWLDRRAGGSEPGPTFRRRLALWGIAAVVAGLMFAPWAAYMRTRSGPGGFGSVAGYYMTMLRVDWLGNVRRHVEMQLFLEGPLSRASVLLAAAAIVMLLPQHAGGARRWALPVALGAGALVLGASGTTLLLTALALAFLIRGFGSLRMRAILAWLGLWVLLAPVYHPYARLLLPFSIATCLVAAACMARLLAGATVPPRSRMLYPVGLLLGAVAVAAGALGRTRDGDPWRPARATANAAATITGQAPAGDRIVVIGEPSLAYYLARSGRNAMELTDGIRTLDTLSTPAFIVAGRYARSAPALRDGLARLAARLDTIGTLALHPNDLRLLDDLAPARARRWLASPDSTFDLKLFRLAPAARSSMP